MKMTTEIAKTLWQDEDQNSYFTRDLIRRATLSEQATKEFIANSTRFECDMGDAVVVLYRNQQGVILFYEASLKACPSTD